MGRDLRRRTVLSVSQIRRNHKLVLRAHRHELQPFGPSLDHPAQTKAGWLSASVGTVELGPIDQRSAVMHLNDIVALGFSALSRLEHLVLQTTGRNLDAFLGLIGRQECLTHHLGLLTVFLALFLRFFANLGAVVPQNNISLTVGDHRRLAAERLRERLDDDLGIVLVAATRQLAFDVSGQEHAHGVTVLLEIGLELTSPRVDSRCIGRRARSGSWRHLDGVVLPQQ